MQYADRNVGPGDYHDLASDELLITKVFYTIQSEGPLVGTPSVFIRLAGCNKGDKLSCPECDTNFLYHEGVKHKIADLVKLVEDHFTTSFRLGRQRFFATNPPLVILTGGEPMLQDNIVALIEGLYDSGHRVQIESNGDRLPAAFLETKACLRSHLVVSPKVLPTTKQYKKLPDAVFQRADYLKFVVDADPSSPYHALPDYVTEWCISKCSSSRIFVSPWTVYARRVEPGEIASIWLDGLIDRERTKANLDHAVSVCLKYGYHLSLQTHLITGVE
jgi:7-carboxy-7-deazaguanine synthase